MSDDKDQIRNKQHGMRQYGANTSLKAFCRVPGRFIKREANQEQRGGKSNGRFLRKKARKEQRQGHPISCAALGFDVLEKCNCSGNIKEPVKQFRHETQVVRRESVDAM